jgi:predicted alpha/beta hydrolase family esterase
LAGDNDPYVPSSQGLEIATNLGVVLDQIPGGGHLNAEFGFTEFPYLWQSLNTLMR